jgi:hypothetical protein
MSETENKRKTKFNPRTLFLAAIKNTELGTTYIARNESNYAGSILTARGAGYVVRGPDFVAQDGIKTIPLLMHKNLQNVGANYEVSLNTSMSFLLDATTGAFRGFSVYASNYPYRPIPAVPLQYFDTHDWQLATQPGLLALPNTDMYADFTTTATVWTSALSPMTPANKVPTGSLDSCSPTAWGATKSIGGMAFGMTQSITSVPRTDLLRYRFDATVWVFGVTHQDQMDIYISVNSRKIVRTVTANDYVVVDATPPYQYRAENIRLTRVEDSKTPTGQS